MIFTRPNGPFETGLQKSINDTFEVATAKENDENYRLKVMGT